MKLPDSWSSKKIADLCEKPQYGYTASSTTSPVGPKMLRITDIQNGEVDWERVPYCECNDISKYRLQKDDIVFARTGATVGKSLLIKDCPKNSIYASYLIRLRAREGVSPDYLSWYFKSPLYWMRIFEDQQGTGQPNFNGTKLANLEVPVPPDREEQDAVVKKVIFYDLQLAKTKDGVNNLERLLAGLKQSIYNKAIDGTLSEKWREKNPGLSSQELLAGSAIRSGIVIGDHPIDGWHICKTDNHFHIFSGGTPSKGNPEYWNGAIPWVSSGDVKTRKISQGSLTITQEGLANSSAKLCRRGSIIIVVRSGILKHTLPVSIVEEEVAINQDIKCFDSNNDIFNCWFALFLKKAETSILAHNRDGTTVQSVKGNTLKGLDMPVPPIEEQRYILDRVGELENEIDNGFNSIAHLKEKLRRLEVSISAKAFHGDLTREP